MLVLKRRRGEGVRIDQYGVTVRVLRVIDARSAWVAIDGRSYGPLRQGDRIKIKDVTLCVTGFHGSRVKLGFQAPPDITIMRTELAGAQ